MVGTALLEKLANLFLLERSKGLYVDRIGIAPAYQGLVTNSYILAVSAPSVMAGNDCNDKVDLIVKFLFDNLGPEDRMYFDRVRVYDSAEEFERHAKCNFDESYYGYCETSLDYKSKIMALA